MSKLAVSDGIATVIGELRCMVTERDGLIEELQDKNKKLAQQIGTLSSQLQEVLDANRRLKELNDSLSSSQSEPDFSKAIHEGQ